MIEWKPRPCTKCAATFIAKDARSTVCEDCQRLHKLWLNRQRYAKARGKVTKEAHA